MSAHQKQEVILKDGKTRGIASRACFNAPEGTLVKFITKDKRTLDQNDMLHPLLRIIAKECKWYGATLSADEWKCVFMSGICEVKAIPGYEPGTVIMVGFSSSKLKKEEFSDLLELILAFGAQQGVDLTDPRQDS